MIITLLGYMGGGKSTIGKQLASVLKYSFIDLDVYIEEKEGKSVPEIFLEKGEIYFRKLEHVCLKEIISNYNNIVLSLGGGTPCYANNMGLLAQNNLQSFYLQLSPVNLANRLFEQKQGRPLIAHIKTKQELQDFIAVHLFERQEFYRKASVVLPVDKLSVQQVVACIIAKLY